MNKRVKTKKNPYVNEEPDKNKTRKTQIAGETVEVCENQIQHFLDDVIRQQTIISQFLQILHFCALT